MFQDRKAIFLPSGLISIRVYVGFDKTIVFRFVSIDPEFGDIEELEHFPLQRYVYLCMLYSPHGMSVTDKSIQWLRNRKVPRFPRFEFNDTLYTAWDFSRRLRANNSSLLQAQPGHGFVHPNQVYQKGSGDHTKMHLTPSRFFW